MSGELENQVRDWLRVFPLEAPAVVVPVYNAYEDVLECVDSLLKTTPAEVPVLVLDDASTDERIFQSLTTFAAAGRLLYVRKPMNTGFVDTVNLAFTASAPRDVVVINSDVVVPPGWLERLRSAAYHRSNIATATPLTNWGTIVSVPCRNKPVPIEGMTVEEIDARVQENSLRLYPIIPTAIGHCVYFKRAALDLVGYLDETFSPGYGEEVDWSQRAVLLGFSHVVADDLFIYHKGSRSFGETGTDARIRLRESHEKLIRQRYPWYGEWTTQAANEREHALAYAIEQARDAILGYRVAVDATCIGGPVTGTQLLTLGLIRALALAKPPDVRLSIIVHDHVFQSRANLLGVDALVDELVPLSELNGLTQPRFSLVHRPFQLHSLTELIFLRTVAHRVVISVLDFIAFSSVGYAVNYADWERYRELIYLACKVADGVVFISQDAANDANHQGIRIESQRVRVVYPGTDYQWYAQDNGIVEKGRLPPLPFILILGTNFRHKNRPYALKLLPILVDQYHWNGYLVFAGPYVSCGGSENEEMAFFESNPELRPRVLDLGPVTETEKLWLLKNASLVLYPSTYEGFGLVPFEAAMAGTPALTARTTALIEVLGDNVLYLDSFDLQESAERVWQLLTDPAMREKQVAVIQARAREFTWEKTAAQLWDFYQRLLRMSPNPSRAVIWPLIADKKPYVMPLGGPFVIRVGRRLKRVLEVTLAEWLKLAMETIQFFRYLLNRRFSKEQR